MTPRTYILAAASGPWPRCWWWHTTGGGVSTVAGLLRCRPGPGALCSSGAS